MFRVLLTVALASTMVACAPGDRQRAIVNESIPPTSIAQLRGEPPPNQREKRLFETVPRPADAPLIRSPEQFVARVLDDQLTLVLDRATTWTALVP